MLLNLIPTYDHYPSYSKPRSYTDPNSTPIKRAYDLPDHAECPVSDRPVRLDVQLLL